jgi:hypothetical protein
LIEKIKAAQREQMRIPLLQSGLELMDDKKSVLIEKIKDVIIERFKMILTVLKSGYK